MHRLQKGAQFTGAHPAWVKTESLHITLVFLGWIEATRREAIEKALAASCELSNAFELRFRRIELFPTPRQPRVISIGIEGGAGGEEDVSELKHLYRKLNLKLSEAEFATEAREFRPHLTLARIKSMKGVSGLRSLVESHAFEKTDSFPVKDAVLYQSHLKRDGAEYEVLSQRLLRKL